MEPEIPAVPSAPEPPPEASESMGHGFPAEAFKESAAGHAKEPEKPYRGLKWIFIGPDGMRAGWSILLFIGLILLLGNGLGFLFSRLHLISKGNLFTPRQQFFLELLQVVAVGVAAA